MRLLCPTVLECEDLPLNKTIILRFDTDALRYQMKVLARGVSAGAIETILPASVDYAVVPVSRAPNSTTESYDSDFYLATFDSGECPKPLKLVRHSTAPGASLLLHHFRHFMRVPRFECYSPSHTILQCTRQGVTCRPTIIAFYPHRRNQWHMCQSWQSIL